MIASKNLIPDKIAKEDQWRRWCATVEDYAEEVQDGMKQKLDAVCKAEHPIAGAVVGEDWWKWGAPLFQFLKRHTGDQLLETMETIVKIMVGAECGHARCPEFLHGAASQ